jgi:hypothetical protein
MYLNTHLLNQFPIGHVEEHDKLMIGSLISLFKPCEIHTQLGVDILNIRLYIKQLGNISYPQSPTSEPVCREIILKFTPMVL